MSTLAEATARASRGVVYVHSAPTSLCPHIAWAVEGILGRRVTLDWTPQPAGTRLVRAELSWNGEAGTGARLASALRGWDHLRYEVTEEPSPGVDGSRWSYTPTLGIHHSWVSASGDALLHEDQVRAALARSGGDAATLEAELDAVLGGAWDRELEPFRYAGDGAPVRWLHKVG
jgi:hypothetical protein